MHASNSSSDPVATDEPALRRRMADRSGSVQPVVLQRAVLPVVLQRAVLPVVLQRAVLPVVLTD